MICCDIGGMSEKVTDGVNGLHFRRRDPEHLAEVMQRAAETPGLWEELQRRYPRRLARAGWPTTSRSLSRHLPSGCWPSAHAGPRPLGQR